MSGRAAALAATFGYQKHLEASNFSTGSGSGSGQDPEEETDYLVDEEDDFQEECGRRLGEVELEEQVILDECLEKYQTVQENVFEELRMPRDVAFELKQTWAKFIASRGFEAAAEAIYAACFDAAPSLQGLFKTPRSLMALRLMGGITNILNLCDNPPAMKTQVEALGSRHFDRDPQPPRVAILRDAMVDVVVMELGGLSPKMRAALNAVLNYIGGANCYIVSEYIGRIRIIHRSWQVANNKPVGSEEEEESQQGEDQSQDASSVAGMKSESQMASTASTTSTDGRDGKTRSGSLTPQMTKSDATATMKSTSSEMKVPTNFKEMFFFNAAVMGFGQNNQWMQLILDQFDDIVVHAADSYRLQEECDILSLVLAQHKGSKVRLTDFKAIMLASLRSLLPKDWDSNHEVAWNWLWENTERILRAHVGKPAVHQKALERFVQSLTEDQLHHLREQLFARFFEEAPAAQDFFKQSTTRLHFIADKIIEMILDIFRGPRQMVIDISALGLRHVAYEVPTELFSPLVSAGVEVMREMTSEAMAAEAFRWSLTLVSKILIRSVLDGSTLVMKAINTNQEKALRRAISVAPRGSRAMQLLEIRVSTQTISPLFWAIESNSLNSAKAMIQDLLTIRADRDNYYYGCDDLFARHPNIIRKLCAEAPTLLEPFLDGLLWRSRLSLQGMRRVNYYIKHLVEDEDGSFNKALQWIVEYRDPKVISHQVVALFSDILWNRLARYYFVLERLYFLLCLCVFAAGQAFMGGDVGRLPKEEERIAVFACRCFTYVGGMGHLLVREIHQVVKDKREGKIERLCNKKIPVPAHLCRCQELGNLALLMLLVLMCIYEPIWWCVGDMYGNYPGAGLFTTMCPAATVLKDTYVVLACAAMILYCILILDLSIVSMRISAFVLVCGRVFEEVALFLGAASFFILTFALGICTLNNQSARFAGIGNAAYVLFAMTLGIYPTDRLAELQDSVGILIAVSAFLILVTIFLLNLLVAQLNQAYLSVFPDMQGHARLKRAGIIVATVGHVSPKAWLKFVKSLDLNKRLEFNEGDVGFAGGIQVTEPATAHPTTTDSIRRYGGSTSSSMPWPDEDKLEADEEDRFERLERLIQQAAKPARRGRAMTSSMGSAGMGSAAGSISSSNESERS